MPEKYLPSLLLTPCIPVSYSLSPSLFYSAFTLLPLPLSRSHPSPTLSVSPLSNSLSLSPFPLSSLSCRCFHPLPQLLSPHSLLFASSCPLSLMDTLLPLSPNLVSLCNHSRKTTDQQLKRSLRHCKLTSSTSARFNMTMEPQLCS